MAGKDTTYELRISFDQAEDAAQIKTRVLEWLSGHGVAGVADTVVDGIEDDVSPETLAAISSENENSLPVAVFDFDETRINLVARDIQKHFGPRVKTQLTLIRTQGWESAWHPDFKGLATSRFWIGPKRDAPATLIHLDIASELSFGTGQHATTEVILKSLELMPVSTDFLDVGTGSGVLAIAATKLGWQNVRATEIDENVLAEARANAIRNEVEPEFLLTDLIPAGKYDVIAANILAPALYKLIPRMASSLRDSGHLLLAGFMAQDETGLQASAERSGLRLAKQSSARDWSCLHFIRED
jgi:ribosomal protein L11 methyltransferase